MSQEIFIGIIYYLEIEKPQILIVCSKEISLQRFSQKVPVYTTFICQTFLLIKDWNMLTKFSSTETENEKKNNTKGTKERYIILGLKCIGLGLNISRKW